MDMLARVVAPDSNQAIASQGPVRGGGRWYLTLAILLIVAVLTRAHLFGNPVAHLDDQFYLLVGRAMLGGELPYIDIWDRKPFGLFLLYSGIAALGGNGVIQTQIVAGFFAALTALVISRIGDRVARFPGGLLAGITYLLLMPMLSGASGQAPVFYNLPMACAALLTLDAWQDRRDPACWRRGSWAMLAVGLAMTIKPTALFEGTFFGLLLLVLRWQQSRSLPAMLSFAAAMIFIAIMPTALTFGFYWSIGGFDDIWQATVVSVLGKAPISFRLAAVLFSMMAIKLLIPVVCAIVSLRRLAQTDRRSAAFFLSWLAAAFMGVVSIPNFFDHYALPFLVPLSSVTAVVLAQPVRGLVWAGVMAGVSSAFTSNILTFDGPARAEQFDRVAATVGKHLKGGCLYVFEGPSHLYTATKACRQTRFIFPDHLNSAIEADALPVKPEEEIARIFDQRPTVVVQAELRFLEENGASVRMLRKQLDCNYRLVGIAKEYGVRFNRPLSIWARRPGWRNCDVG